MGAADFAVRPTAIQAHERIREIYRQIPPVELLVPMIEIIQEAPPPN